MRSKWLVWILAAVLVFTACARKTADPEPIPEEPGTQAVSDWTYDLVAQLEGSGGIQIDTDFTLLSDVPLDADTVRGHLTFTPEVPFELETITETAVRVRPTASLTENTVYQVKLSGLDDAEYVWAFQTERALTAISTLPGDGAEYVPVNTGIEIRFNVPELEDPETYFHIEPAVEGTFTSNGDAMVFIPKGLERDTTYRVTVDAGLHAPGGEKTLEEPVVFTFSTEPVSWNARLALSSDILNFTHAQQIFLPMQISEAMAAHTYEITLFSFATAADFIRDMRTYDETGSFDLVYLDGITMETALQFDASPVRVEWNYMELYTIELPDSLEDGQYLARVTLEGRSVYAFLQISDLLVYDAAFDEGHFLWILDALDGDAVAGANVVLDGIGNGTSDAEGVAIIETPSAEDLYEPVYVTVRTDGRNDFVARVGRSIFWPYMRGYFPFYEQTAHDQYWTYLFTDRSTYSPTDAMQVFGYLKPRGAAQDRYVIRLVSQVNGTDVIEERALVPDGFGTFSTEFSWSEMSSGSYALEIRSGDVLVERRDLSIQSYTKPTYKLSGDFDKPYYRKGDTLIYELNSMFFDGTPAPDMAFNYYLYAADSMSGNVTSDASGAARIQVVPKVDTESWRPIYAQMEVYNDDAENTRINRYDSVLYLPKNKMLEIETQEQGDVPKATLLGHMLDTSGFDPMSPYDYALWRGTPLNESVSVTVTESWFEKIETGSYYDYINKVTRTSYDYQRRTQVVDTRSVSLTAGEAVLEMPYATDSEHSYEIEVTLKDTDGSAIVERAVLHTIPYPYFDPLGGSYTLELQDETDVYGPGDTVHYRLQMGDALPETAGDRLLVMRLQSGLKDYVISDRLDGSFVYDETDIPNLYLKGVYYHDGMLSATEYARQVRFDTELRALDIAAQADKTLYGPGDTVTLSLTARDPDGQPAAARINVSVVDEAYFTLFSQSADMLADLYSPAYSTGLLAEYVSSNLAGGELLRMFGAEGGDALTEAYLRQEFKDTATFLLADTDASGSGAVSFQVPDNLTSWRITLQGVDQSMNAGTRILNIPVGLPLFISAILGDTYIDGDQPSISLRTYGDMAVPGTEVEYRITIDGPDGSREFLEQGAVGEYTNISLGTVNTGAYTVTVQASSGELADAIRLPFTVVESTVRFDNLEKYQVIRGMSFDPVYSNARLTFSMESSATFYRSLMDLRYGGGNRVDQMLSAAAVQRFIQETLEPQLVVDRVSLKPYQQQDGGISLLPYSGSDPLISTRVAMTGTADLNNEWLVNYFNRLTASSDTDRFSRISAFAGLAALGEPVLVELKAAAGLEDLTVVERLLIGLGRARLGDLKGAQSAFESTMALDPNGVAANGLSFSNDDATNTLAQALLMNLSLKVGDTVTGDALFDRLYLHPSKFELVALEQTQYLSGRNIMDTPQMQSLTGEVTLVNGGETLTFELFGFETRTLTVTREELTALEVRSVDGDMAVHIRADGGVEDLAQNTTESFSLTRTYESASGDNTFEQSDEIVVTLDPSVSDTRYLYEITDFIPAGFRFVKAETYSGWAEVDGQKIVFHYAENENRHLPIRYTIQAVQPGEYTADHAVIVRYGEIGVQATEQRRLIIR